MLSLKIAQKGSPQRSWQTVNHFTMKSWTLFDTSKLYLIQISKQTIHFVHMCNEK